MDGPILLLAQKLGRGVKFEWPHFSMRTMMFGVLPSGGQEYEQKLMLHGSGNDMNGKDSDTK